MDIKILTYTERSIPAKELMKLYQNAGWWPERQEQDLEEMLKHELSVGVWYEGGLIGFARAVSDSRFRAYIEDVVIHSDYQKTGIGAKLLEKLLEQLSHIDVISLFCEEHLIPFYEKNRFKRSKSQFVMHRKS